MKSITPFLHAVRPMSVVLLLAAGFGIFAANAGASESGGGSPRDSRCETRDTCTNLQAPAPDLLIEAQASRTHLQY